MFVNIHPQGQGVMRRQKMAEDINTGDVVQAIPAEMLTVREYADLTGQSYENVRRKLPSIQKMEDLRDGIVLLKNPKTKQNVTYIDKRVQDYLAEQRKAEPIIIQSDSEKVAALELELKETRADRDRQRNEKEMYLKKVQEVQEQLLKLQNNPEQSLDRTKYVLLEDHEKTEKMLLEKEKEIEKISSEKKKVLEENEQLKEDNKILADTTKKNIELARSNEEKLKEIEKKQNELNEAERKNDAIKRDLADAEIAKDKANAEKLILEAKVKKAETEIEDAKAETERLKKKAEQELEEALNLGFFARLKKRKELKKKKEEKTEE